MKRFTSTYRSVRSFTLPPAAMSTTLVLYFLVNVILAVVMLFLPVLGIVGAVALNLGVLFFLGSRYALPLYIVLAGPSLALTVSKTGTLSRLYLGNLLFVMVSVIWILYALLPKRKAGKLLLEPSLLTPLLAFIFSGLLSIGYSRLAPDPNVQYVFPHSTIPLTVVNLAEVMLLIGLPLFLIIVPGVVHTLRDMKWVIAAFIFIGTLYGLGSVFAIPLGLHSNQSILGFRRPRVFGLDSSTLGTIIVLFALVTLSQAFYTTKNGLRTLYGILTVVMSAGVIMTFGREAWIGLFLSVLVMFLFRTKNFSVLFVLLVPLLLLLIPGATDFFNSSKTYGSDRTRIWRDAYNLWLHSPVFGVGAGNFQFFDLTYGSDKVGLAHNQYLEVLAEMGVQGLVSLIWFYVVIGIKSVKAFTSARSRQSKAVALMLIGMYVSIVFGGFFEDFFIPSASAGGGTGPFVSATYRWILLGLLLSIPNWEKEAVQAEKEEDQPAVRGSEQAELALSPLVGRVE